MPFEIGPGGNATWVQGKPGDPLFRFSAASKAYFKKSWEEAADEKLARLLETPDPSSEDVAMLEFLLLMIRWRQGEITADELKEQTNLPDEDRLWLITARQRATRGDNKHVAAFVEQVETRLKVLASKGISPSPRIDS